MKREVVLIDAGGTNIGSVSYALERLGARAILTDDAGLIRSAERVVLPGVGAAGPGMARLRAANLVQTIQELTQPVLGVCLGMQLLYGHSEEGDTECLGALPGRVRRLPGGPGLRVPHMGWNLLEPLRDDPLLDGIKQPSWAYFVHTYAAAPDAATVAASTHGGPFAAVVRSGNFCGMQFHPERSSLVGARLLENFLNQ